MSEFDPHTNFPFSHAKQKIGVGVISTIPLTYKMSRVVSLKKRLVSRKDLNSANKACFHLLKVRPRSEYELRSRLAIKGFDKEIIDQAIDRLTKSGLIDDLAFARLWVESRIKKPLGASRLYFELKTKGVDKEIIEQAISEYSSPEKEEEAVRNLLKQKMKKISNLDKQKIKNRLWGFFLRRGFSKEIVFDVLSEIK